MLNYLFNHLLYDVYLERKVTHRIKRIQYASFSRWDLLVIFSFKSLLTLLNME